MPHPVHVSALHVGHLHVVMLLKDQLYEMCGVFWGIWCGAEGERTRSRYFNSAYHDLGLLQVRLYV